MATAVIIATESTAVVITPRTVRAVVPPLPEPATITVASRSGLTGVAPITAVPAPRLPVRPIVGGVGGHRHDSCLEVLQPFSRIGVANAFQ
ncbi:hypothetical protein AB4Z54_39705 [Streptomyces sp. MCAF7]